VELNAKGAKSTQIATGQSTKSNAADHVSDSALDARTTDDSSYLNQLGYKQELNRSLGIVSSFGVQFSSIAVGSALLTTLVLGLAVTGPAAFWAFAIGGGLQILTVGLAIAQLVSAYPLTGGVYQIVARITGSPFLGWLTGWVVVVGHTVSLPAIAISLVPFIAGWFGQAPEGAAQWPWVLGIMGLSTIVNLLGVKLSSRVNNVGVFCEVIGIGIAIAALVMVKHPTQPLSIINDDAGASGGHWFLGFALAMVLPGYIVSGFDTTGNLAEETKNAARIAPLGTITGSLFAWLVGIGFLLLVLLAIPDVGEVMRSATPVSDILNSAIGPVLTTIFEATAVLALISTCVVLQATAARILWSQARDGQMPAASWFRRTSRFNVPGNATIVTFVVAVLSALWSSLFVVLAAIVAVAWALGYTVAVIVGLVAIIRKQLPAHPWHYGRLSPVVFVAAVLWSFAFCTALIMSDPFHVGFGLLGTIGVGIVLYFLIPKSRRGRIHDPNSVK
jgi:amino acid transporter